MKITQFLMVISVACLYFWSLLTVESVNGQSIIETENRRKRPHDAPRATTQRGPTHGRPIPRNRSNAIDERPRGVGK